MPRIPALAELNEIFARNMLKRHFAQALAEEHFDQWCTGYIPAARQTLRIRLPEYFHKPRPNWWSC